MNCGLYSHNTALHIAYKCLLQSSTIAFILEKFYLVVRNLTKSLIITKPQLLIL